MLAFNLPRPKKVKTPILVLGASKDTVFSPAEVKATARAYNTTADIFNDMAHDMMLDPKWESVAERSSVSAKGLACRVVGRWRLTVGPCWLRRVD